MGLLGGPVSAARQTLGHWISLAITVLMMSFVTFFLYSKSYLRKQNKAAGLWNWYGPTVLVAISSILILCEPVRHILQDIGWWEECGNNDVYPRLNETWNDGCTWSSSQYNCDKLCYVPAGYSKFDCSDGGGLGCGGDIKEFPQYIVDDIANPDTAVEDYCHCTDDETMGNLSTGGLIFTVGITYLGFFIMTLGVMWNAQIITKLAKVKSQFRALRDPEYAKSLKNDGAYQVDYVKGLVAKNPCIVFSKTTCPFCFKAKTALDECSLGYDCIELDQLDNGPAIQKALELITGQRTVPNVFIGGSSIGGGDDTARLHKSGELATMLRDAGASPM